MMDLFVRLLAGTDQNLSGMAVLVLLVIALGLFSAPVRHRHE